jgi:hypothetical protein
VPPVKADLYCLTSALLLIATCGRTEPLIADTGTCQAGNNAKTLVGIPGGHAAGAAHLSCFETIDMSLTFIKLSGPQQPDAMAMNKYGLAPI